MLTLQLKPWGTAATAVRREAKTAVKVVARILNVMVATANECLKGEVEVAERKA